MMLMCQSDTDMPKTTAVTFTSAGHRWVTVRDQPKPFALVEQRRPMHAGDQSR